jgi:cytochrome c-type biogenesis protein CcmH
MRAASTRSFVAVIALALASFGAGARAEDPAPLATTGAACVGDATPSSAGTMTSKASSFARADVREIAEKITCYCGCPHLQVSKCFCGTAEDIREDLARRLDAGESPDAIIAAYLAEHGTWELAVPPKTGFNWIIWLGPVFLVGVGATALLFIGRFWMRPSPAAAPALLDAETEERYRAQLARELEADR